MNRSFVLKGNICYSLDESHLATVEGGYLVCENDRSKGVFTQLPAKYASLPLTDWGDRLIIPGLVDLHIHAPQYPFRALGMDLELLDWLNQHTFPEESKYQDLDYATKAYEIFVDDLKASATTRASVFATLHVPATLLLMNLLEDTNLKTVVGKVNMDRNAPPYLCEESPEQSIKDTLTWLTKSEKFANTKPILTPRFLPTCSDSLMEQLREVQITHHLPVQSHLSENFSEIAWVQELCPSSTSYADAYRQFGAIAPGVATIMAHCVHCTPAEISLLKENGVFVAHCPQSNTNLSSGIAPIRTYIKEGLSVGLGSDVAGGSSPSIFQAMTDAIQVSKLRWRLVDQDCSPLTIPEAFYLATKGGGAFFGKVGSFEPDYEFDAVVIDDSHLRHPQPLTILERLERSIYLSDECQILGKYVAGNTIFKN